VKSKVMLVQPWNYHDEGVVEHDLSREWRNGPYSLVLLATQLRKHDHEVLIVDMMRDLVLLRGDVEVCLHKFSQSIRDFRPDIIGFGFFSIHYFETKKAVEVARKTCETDHINAIFLAGGIHASTEPEKTISELGFDYAFVGEGDLGLLEIADGQKLESIQGVVGASTRTHHKGQEVRPLDTLPFPDWSLCDFDFYAHPSYAKVKFRTAKTLDLVMGRGCVYKCAFCAYNALSSVRFYSAEYLIDQIENMLREFDIDSVYFTDSTIGNNRKLITDFSELMIRRGLSKRVEWYANMRPNQVTEELLQLMWRAGCRFLFYGFESGSQRVIDLMIKGMDVRENYRAAELHNKLRFPYHASILLGYPGETEQDILETFEFLEAVKPPIVGVNWYVPLPGSPDYDKLKEQGVIRTEDPMEWRRIGEVNSARVYADVPESRFRELFARAERIAYVDTPKLVRPAWGCLSPPQSENPQAAREESERTQATFGTLAMKLLRSVRV
jgi:anaerobic magnesium-protoporphyrin IX monomethyl ester cyclase